MGILASENILRDRETTEEGQAGGSNLPQNSPDRPSTPTCPETHRLEKTPDNKLTFEEFQSLRQTLKDNGIIEILFYLTDFPEFVPQNLRNTIPSRSKLKDYEGNPSAFTVMIDSDDIEKVVKVAHKLSLKIGLLGALTSGTNNFGNPGFDYGTNILLAIRPKYTGQTIETKAVHDYPKVGEYKILEENGKTTIFVGIGPTPEEINSFLGKQFTVPLDLTTKNQAQHQAVYATGGRGPNRISPSQVIKRVIVTDGQKTFELTGEEIEKHEGMLGADLVILAIEYYAFEIPRNEFAFYLPLNIFNENPNHWTEQQAEVIRTLRHSFVIADSENMNLKSRWKNGYLNGAEAMLTTDMLSAMDYSPTDEKSKIGRRFAQKASEYALYISGRTNLDPESALLDAIYRNNAFEEFNLSREDFEGWEITTDDTEENPFETIVRLVQESKARTPEPLFKNSDLKAAEMLREGIPDSAKNDVKQGKNQPHTLIFSKSTDYNTTENEPAKLSTKKMIEQQRIQLEPYLKYETRIDDLRNNIRERFPYIQIDIRVWKYGHGNPNGIDMHSRVTAKVEYTDETKERAEEAFTIITNTLKQIHKQLTIDIVKLRNQNINVMPGEKAKFVDPELLSEEQRVVVGNLIDPNGILGWRVKGTPQEKLFQKAT